MRKFALFMCLAIVLSGALILGGGSSSQEAGPPSPTTVATSPTSAAARKPAASTTTTEVVPPEVSVTTLVAVAGAAPPSVPPPVTVPVEGLDVQWTSFIAGDWVSPQSQGGDEYWTFDIRTTMPVLAGTASWNYWPRGFTGGEAAGSGAPAEINRAAWRVVGGVLIVRTAVAERRYANLRGAGGSCFAANYDGSTLTFCRAGV